MLEGLPQDCEVVWDEITMQDEVDHANARYYTARARKLERELELSGQERGDNL